MQIKYKCSCKVDPIEITVTDRHKNGDVVDWIENCVRASIAVDHRARSPLCQNETCDIMIPVDTDHIGVPPTMN